MRDCARLVPGLTSRSAVALRGSQKPSTVETEGVLPPCRRLPPAGSVPPVGSAPPAAWWPPRCCAVVGPLSPRGPGWPAAAPPPVSLSVALEGGVVLAQTETGGLKSPELLLSAERKAPSLPSVAPSPSVQCWSSSSDTRGGSAACCRTSSRVPESSSLSALLVDPLLGPVCGASSSGGTVAWRSAGLGVRDRRSWA